MNAGRKVCRSQRFIDVSTDLNIGGVSFSGSMLTAAFCRWAVRERNRILPRLSDLRRRFCPRAKCRPGCIRLLAGVRPRLRVSVAARLRQLDLWESHSALEHRRELWRDRPRLLAALCRLDWGGPLNGGPVPVRHRLLADEALLDRLEPRFGHTGLWRLEVVRRRGVVDRLVRFEFFTI